MRSTRWILLAAALLFAGCDDDEEPGTTSDATDTQVADTGTAGDTAVGDDTGDDVDTDVDPPDVDEDLDVSVDADADEVDSNCSSSTFPTPCTEPLGDIGALRCVDATTMSICEVTVTADGCHAYGEWQDTACSSDAVCVEDLGCQVPPAEPRGTCEQHTDCPSGSTCLAVVDDTMDPPRSWWTCASAPPEAESCTASGLDACCNSAECTDGAGGGCFTGPLFYCGGAAPMEANECVYDLCTADADCPAAGPNPAICLPGGAFGEPGARCDSSSTCRFDEDCDSRAGGQCLPFFEPCRGRFAGFHCTYDDSTCRTDADCTNGEHCTAGTDGATTCEEFFPPP